MIRSYNAIPITVVKQTRRIQHSAQLHMLECDNESNKYGRHGNFPNARQFSNNKMKITRKQTRDDHSAVQSPRAPRSDNIPDRISDTHTYRKCYRFLKALVWSCMYTKPVTVMVIHSMFLSLETSIDCQAQSK